jgi:hypothetical protein
LLGLSLRAPAKHPNLDAAPATNGRYAALAEQDPRVEFNPEGGVNNMAAKKKHKKHKKHAK